jgi:hypothetical protein
MLGYLTKAMTCFKHETPNKIQTSPHHHIKVEYGAKKQYLSNEEEPPALNKKETKYVQAVAGTFLYYARAVDPTIFPALSSLATEQAKPMQKTIQTVKQLLDYCATQEQAIITYSTSKMILCIHSNVGYCNEKNTISQVGGQFFLANNEHFPPNNEAIMTNATIIKVDMLLAA